MNVKELHDLKNSVGAILEACDVISSSKEELETYIDMIKRNAQYMLVIIDLESGRFSDGRYGPEDPHYPA